MRVDGKVAVVTGGSGGIGAETARTLAREGAKVVIADVVEPAGQAIAREIGAKFYKLDVTNEQQWQALVGDVVTTHGKIDVLVNAGFATPTALAYGASKAAVAQVTRSFAIHGANGGKRVRCNSVHPGVIKTRMTDNIITEFGKMSTLTPEQSETAIMSVVPFKVRGVPADVANLILFLASDESAYVTGSEFQVDGGWHVINAG